MLVTAILDFYKMLKGARVALTVFKRYFWYNGITQIAGLLPKKNQSDNFTNTIIL